MAPQKHLAVSANTTQVFSPQHRGICTALRCEANTSASFPKENILPRPVFGTKKRFRIRTRILRLAELFKMNARLVRALRRDIQPSARRAGR
jgi:hypothetical protein